MTAKQNADNFEIQKQKKRQKTYTTASFLDNKNSS